ncbi:MAG: hypothetical protein ABI553_10025, partial [Chloroflexota bacterium]
MTALDAVAAVLVIVGFVAATMLVRPAVRRTGLLPWHPAVAWLALMALFFGIGSAMLAFDGRAGPALYVAGSTLVFGLAVAGSDRVARRRADAAIDRAVPAGTSRPAVAARLVDDAPLRPATVVGLALLGLILIAP